MPLRQRRDQPDCDRNRVQGIQYYRRPDQKSLASNGRRVETPTHWLTIGYDQDLNKALDILKAETAKFIAEQRGVSAAEAQRIMQQTWDCRIAESGQHLKGAYWFNSRILRRHAPGRAADKGYGTDLFRMAATPPHKRWKSPMDDQPPGRKAEDDALGPLGSPVLRGLPARRPSDAEKNVHCLTRRVFGKPRGDFPQNFPALPHIRDTRPSPTPLPGGDDGIPENRNGARPQEMPHRNSASDNILPYHQNLQPVRGPTRVKMHEDFFEPTWLSDDLKSRARAMVISAACSR